MLGDACDLATVGDLWFSGDLHFDDLPLLLSSDIPSLCVSCDGLKKSGAPLLQEYISVTRGNLKCIKNFSKVWQFGILVLVANVASM